MADEAIIVELLGENKSGDPVRYTVADGTGIAKGSLMELTSPRTMKIVSGVDVPIVGILAQEKVASDGQTSCAVYTNGIFQMTCGAAESAAIGDFVSAGAVVNEINIATAADFEKGWAFGYALETIVGNGVGQIKIRI